MDRYPNVYADFSYNIYESDLIDNLASTLLGEGMKSKLSDRVMFGSDFWMIISELPKEWLFDTSQRVACRAIRWTLDLCYSVRSKGGSPQPRGCILTRLVPGQAYLNGAKRKE